MPALRARRGAAVRASAAIKASEAADTDTTSSNVSRPSRRTASESAKATVSRDPVSSPSNHQSLRLTVKLSSTKLRQATGGISSRPSRAAAPAVANSKDAFVSGDIVVGKRARNVKKSYVVESDSDDDEDEDEDDDEEMEDVSDDDAEGESAEEEDAIDEDAEGEEIDEDADGDIDMVIPPPPPTIKISKAERSGKSNTITVRPAGRSDNKTVEQKETQESDDEELSDLESSLEDDEEEEGMQLGNEEDAEGEDEEIEIEVDDEEEEEDELDSDDETPGGGSRASTPDLTKLTKRQRARLEEGGSGHLLALPDEVQVKKHLTAEEHAMRRAEMARRRKNLSEKRNEEEKMETINKLLKKQAPKTNARRRDFNGIGNDATPDGEPQKPNPIFVRWISNKDGNRIGVPEEWTAGPVGNIFVGNGVASSTKLIEEVQ